MADWGNVEYIKMFWYLEYFQKPPFDKGVFAGPHSFCD